MIKKQDDLIKPPFMEDYHKRSLAWDTVNYIRKVHEVDDPAMWDIFLDHLAEHNDLYSELYDRLKLRDGSRADPEVEK